ncbi:uncharacterized protein LOC111798237 isoform X1 [Cucurbita pepo subsp. pepo]|uniref:uncharacterized protein LOC111798237 isoform X1 n=1 Tax=Cucurbita pepo subsp. pepo TaxID=3664 RepID=UPI000C9D4B92|nr:uncharacterized protein LOC111798237 isoform X1 [Cucurbita pepo subsp. pepo]
MLRALSPAPFFYFFSALPPPSSLPNRSLHRLSPMAVFARIAVVGDVHGDWDLREDTKALQLLQPDLVLFTGDFGEENVELVRSIAELKFAKLAILGNHDAWFTPCFSQEKKDGVQLQLECLGKDHIAYRRVDFPEQKLSIVGGRPFSHGGRLFRRQLLSARYGVKDMETSAKRIYEAAIGAPEDHLVIILAHNGPSGLGSCANDICGKDWVFGGGDNGDEDLAQAISSLKENGKFHAPPLVVFGHMHKELAYGGGHRKMIVVAADNTIYLNGAIVPRVHSNFDEESEGRRTFTSSETSSSQPVPIRSKRAFTVIDVSDGRVDKITESWISVVGDESLLNEEHLMYKSSH